MSTQTHCSGKAAAPFSVRQTRKLSSQIFCSKCSQACAFLTGRADAVQLHHIFSKCSAATLPATPQHCRHCIAGSTARRHTLSECVMLFQRRCVYLTCRTCTASEKVLLISHQQSAIECCIYGSNHDSPGPAERQLFSPLTIWHCPCTQQTACYKSGRQAEHSRLLPAA